MADLEGVDGILGSDAPERDIEAPLAGADAVALSLAMQKVGDDPKLSGAASDYLAEQKRLVQLQIKHFDEERRLGIAAAKRKRYADHIRNGLYTCIGLLVLGLLAAAIRMTVEAMSDGGLVVESFTVPPDLAARGATGEALAEDLASRVAIVRAAAARASLDQVAQVRADQSGYLKVQIPETGISIDELERFLHRWLGHQTVLSGEVRDTAGGQVSVVLHVGDTQRIEVRGSGADLDRLMQETAEKAFEIFSPANFIQYLEITGRYEDAWNALQRHIHSPEIAALPRPDRADFCSLYAFDDPDRHRALSSALISIDIDPRVFVTWRAAAVASADLGHDQAAIDFYRHTLSRKKGDQPTSERDAYLYLLTETHANIDWALGDFTAFEADAGYQRSLAERYAVQAEAAAGLHDLARSQQDLARELAAGSASQWASLGFVRLGEASWYVSSRAGNWPQALTAARALAADTEAQRAAAPTPEFASRYELMLETQYRPLLAYAEAMTGDTASAAALISQTPTDCYLCVRTRAKIAAVAGDAATADRWFAEAVRQAPELPMAYFEWGQALLARGDLAGAAREYSLAYDKGPQFADPLKGWGDALAKQGHWSDALSKYDEALKYAPNWAALKQAREVAVRRS